MILPGIVSVTFRERSEVEILELSSNCGLKAIEWSENAHVHPGMSLAHTICTQEQLIPACR